MPYFGYRRGGYYGKLLGSHAALGDTTAPTLSNATGSATAPTTASLSVDTDEGNGTLYWFVSTSATPPSAADLKAGTGAAYAANEPVVSTGTKTETATGLTAGQVYYLHALHTDDAANDSSIVTSASWTQHYSVTKTDNAVTGADATTYTFSGKSLGTAATGRRIVVGVSTVDTATITFSSLTIGGTGATAVVTNEQTSGGGYVRSSLYVLQVDAGTTADIVLTCTGAQLRAGIGVWAIYGLSSDTANDTDSSTANPMTFGLNVNAGGVGISYVGNWQSGAEPTHSWAGLTEQFDQGYGDTPANGSQSGASDQFASAQSPLTVTCTPSGSNARVMVGASWG